MSISLRDNKTGRICLDAILCALAMMLSYLEVLLPLYAVVPLPGFRLGLANVVVVAAFFLLSWREAACISLVRILLMGMLFGSATSLYFSFLGGAVSFIALCLMGKIGRRCSFVGISAVCAASHNVGQILAAVTLFGPELIRSYLPLLLLASMIYGSAVGMLLNLSVPKLEGLLHRAGIGGTTE